MPMLYIIEVTILSKVQCGVVDFYSSEFDVFVVVVVVVDVAVYR
jgi:hypothetical protein